MTTLAELLDCMVCREWRPEPLIAVAHRSLAAFENWPYPTAPRPHFNVRYCADRPSCAAYANAAGHWAGPPVESGAAE